MDRMSKCRAFDSPPRNMNKQFIRDTIIKIEIMSLVILILYVTLR